MGGTPAGATMSPVFGATPKLKTIGKGSIQLGSISAATSPFHKSAATPRSNYYAGTPKTRAANTPDLAGRSKHTAVSTIPLGREMLMGRSFSNASDTKHEKSTELRG